MPIDDVRREFGQLWARLGPFWGISPTTARVYALLLSSARPLDGEAIADELEMSRGGVSMACRELVDWGLVHANRPAGSRRVLYRVEEDSEKVIRAIVATRKRREWNPILESVRDWQTELARDRSTDARTFRSRLTEIEGLMALVDSTAETFLEGGLIPRLGLKALVKGARRKRPSRRQRTRPLSRDGDPHGSDHRLLPDPRLLIALAVGTLACVQRPLNQILLELCGAPHRARFWTRFFGAMLLISVLFFCLWVPPDRAAERLALHDVLGMVRAGLFGLLAGLALLALVVLVWQWRFERGLVPPRPDQPPELPESPWSPE